jgi:hypothetical protein
MVNGVIYATAGTRRAMVALNAATSADLPLGWNVRSMTNPDRSEDLRVVEILARGSFKRIGESSCCR